MKKLKLFLLISSIIILTGCSSKELSTAYNNMHATEKGINGYYFTLKIYGEAEDKNYNEIVKTQNYMDEKFQVTIVNNKEKPSVNEQETPTKVLDEVIYILNDKIYQEKDDKYVEIDESNYKNPLIYIETLKNVTKVEESMEEKIGENTYKLFKVILNKKHIENVLMESGINLSVDENIKADIYIDSKGYLYKMKYYIQNLTVSINYYRIGDSEDINIF